MQPRDLCVLPSGAKMAYVSAVSRRYSSVSTARAYFAQCAIAGRNLGNQARKGLLARRAEGPGREVRLRWRRWWRVLRSLDEAPRVRPPCRAAARAIPQERVIGVALIEAQQAARVVRRAAAHVRGASECARLHLEFVLRRARASPMQAFLCPPELQSAFWHAGEQYSVWKRAHHRFESVCSAQFAQGDSTDRVDIDVYPFYFFITFTLNNRRSRSPRAARCLRVSLGFRRSYLVPEGL